MKLEDFNRVRGAVDALHGLQRIMRNLSPVNGQGVNSIKVHMRGDDSSRTYDILSPSPNHELVRAFRAHIEYEISKLEAELVSLGVKL